MQISASPPTTLFTSYFLDQKLSGSHWSLQMTPSVVGRYSGMDQAIAAAQAASTGDKPGLAVVRKGAGFELHGLQELVTGKTSSVVTDVDLEGDWYATHGREIWNVDTSLVAVIDGAKALHADGYTGRFHGVHYTLLEGVGDGDPTPPFGF